ncbi:MAG: hypothetical protein LBI89_03240, partial [Prevotellaceae bacterium]|nr:hypothetical protein [Prevotellaceae bacterium]
MSAQVSITNMAADYTARQISFTVAWTEKPHDNKIWVIVDYIKVENAAAAGSWSRAEIGGLPAATGSATAATVSGNRGFWLHTSGGSGSAGVTVTLSLAAGVDKYNWCAFALNYPPEAKMKADGGYDLKGTPPFTITYNSGSSTVTGANTFDAGCITAITDATDNPDGIVPELRITGVNSPTICYNAVANLAASVVGGTATATTYTWDIGGTVSTTGVPAITSQALSASTTYTVTAEDPTGCTSSGEGTITVADPDVPAAPVQDGPACAGTAITFTATVPPGATGLDWKGSVSGEGTSKTTAATAGTYEAQVRSFRTSNGTTCYSAYSGSTGATITGV